MRVAGKETPRVRLARMMKIVQKINELEEETKILNQDEMIALMSDFRKKIANKTHTLDDILPQVFALVRETSVRTLGLRHYDVQLIGGIALHQGFIAEMCTGEGKTLAATLPACLNSLSGEGVHVVTVNDYLAKRDLEWMGQIYNYLGLSTGCVTQFTSDEDKKSAYNADITYVTNNELGFDYLRDHMATQPSQLKQRTERSYAIVDEVDSILIDEARTPLIISGPSESFAELCMFADEIITGLKSEDYEKDEKHHNAILTTSGLSKVESVLKMRMVIQETETLYAPRYSDIVHTLHQSLKAHTLYRRDVDYMIKGGEVVLIDEFTGRIMTGRRYSDGLHQAIEAKEKVEIKDESVTLASITYQSYFRMYKRLSGMTGTAATEAEEFKKTYDIEVMTVPTHRPIARIDQHDVLYATNEEKVVAICNLVKERHAKGQPILIGTSSVSSSEEMSAAFTQAGISHRVLNAKHHEYEAQIIAEAGNIGAVTIATSMAGRGTDIKLGGSNELEKQKVRELGGLLVLVTERHDNRRIDNQFRGRSGRQGDPGESIFFVSLEDKLMRCFDTNGQLKAAFENLGEKSVSGAMMDFSIENSQKRVEKFHFETRKHVLQYDEVINEQRKIIYEMRQQLLMFDEAHAAHWVFQILTEVLDEALVNIDHVSTDELKTYIKTLFGVEPKSSDPTTIQHQILLECIFVDTQEHQLLEIIRNLSFERIKQQVDNRPVYEYIRAYTNIGPIKAVCLQCLDRRWRDHITLMDHIKQQCQMQSYAQKDPLKLYKTEALPSFEKLTREFREEITNTVSRTQQIDTLQTLDVDTSSKIDRDLLFE